MDVPVQRLREVVEPAVRGVGLLLDGLDVARAGRSTRVVVTVDVDLDDPGELDLDRVGLASAAVGAALDAADLLPGAYQLEVSSPGAERPLTTPRHYARALGRTVRLVLASGAIVEGRLSAAGDEALVVVPRGPARKGRPVRELAPVTVAPADVTSGRVLVDLSGLGPDDATSDEEA